MRTKSYISIITSMLIFSTIGIFRRFIDMPSSLLSMCRGFIGSLFILCFINIRKIIIDKNIDKKNLMLLVLTGILIGINWILLFESYNYTTVPVATLCYYMQPTIVILLSPIVLKEKLAFKKLACAFVAIIGMIFVSGVQSQQIINLKGIAFALSASALYAIVVIINKRITIQDSYLKTMIQLFFAAISLIPYVMISKEYQMVSLNVATILLILIVGIIHTGIAYCLYFSSMNDLKGQSIAILSYIDPVFSIVFASIFLNEVLSPLGIMGSILIIGSAIISELG